MASLIPSIRQVLKNMKSHLVTVNTGEDMHSNATRLTNDATPLRTDIPEIELANFYIVNKQSFPVTLVFSLDP